jgi:hypothetical protein
VDRGGDRQEGGEQEAERLEYLKKLGAARRLRGPIATRPTNTSRRLSRKLPMRVLKLKEAYPRAKAELWCEDEHRLGLKLIIRKGWSPPSERPLARSTSVTSRPAFTLSYDRKLERFVGLSYLPSTRRSFP